MVKGLGSTYDLLLLRSDDLERLVRGAGSGGFNLGTGLVVFDNVPRLSAYPPVPAPRWLWACNHRLRNTTSGRMRVCDEPVDNVDMSGAHRKASRSWCFTKVVPSRLRRRRK